MPMVSPSWKREVTTLPCRREQHKIDLYNYGYKSETRNVTIEAHKTTVIDVTMQAIPGTVSGPWGCITLEGADRDAVLLNGKDPAAFFVGHGDEFNNEWGWKQELIVPPGKYELTVMQCGDQMPGPTTVDVPANQRVVVDAYKGVRKTVAWPRGEQLQSLPRFKAGTASAQVAVQKVTGQFSASPAQINCGDSAHLTWSSDGAGENRTQWRARKRLRRSDGPAQADHGLQIHRRRAGWSLQLRRHR